MDSADSKAVEHVVREHVRAGHRISAGPVWLTIFPDGVALPEHGWKLHVSARSTTYLDLVDTLVPSLLAEGCVFKLARSREVLSTLNDGYSSPASVGKAFTIYPDRQRVRELGLYLVELLRGHDGPRVLSDRQVDRSAPVYYRYGPFTKAVQADAHGRLVSRIHGPAGEEFEALAGLRYRQPAWATDPFTGRRADEQTASADATVLGRHYRVVAGIFESARGNVYRAVDQRDGTSVVVKQARAMVDEQDGLGDIRMRLRNERRVLQALDGCAGVPRFLDHFRHGPDEYLVTTDAGPCNLFEDVVQNGPYPIASPGTTGGGRSLQRLGRQLAEILLDVHARGVVMRDLAPKNVVVDGDKVSIVDFGVAGLEGLHIPGGTEGYAPARQQRDEPPRDTDDLHALAMTLLFAAQYLRPVVLGDEPDLPRLRALQSIRSAYGEEPTGMIDVIADLLGDGDGDGARDALRRLAAEDVSVRRTKKGGPARSLPAPPSVTPELAADITENLLTDLLGHTRAILAGPPSIAHAPDVYSGTAGIGLELLEHLDRPGVADCLHDLVAFTVHAMPQLSPGLFSGRTGVDVFVSRARSRGIEPPDGYSGPHIPGAEWVPEDIDLIAGTAGVGLGHLVLSQDDDDPVHLAVVDRCVESVLNHRGFDTRLDTDRSSGWVAVDSSAGLAHGGAGGVELLISAGERTGDERLLAEAAKRTERLAERARIWVDRARDGVAPPLVFAWCRGLGGIAHTLLHASVAFDDPAPADLVKEIGSAVGGFLPRIGVLNQCCGAAGIGNALIDLAVYDGDPRHWDAACAVGVQMLLRSGGPSHHPIFMRDLHEDYAAGLASGLAGVLGFFRRLSRQGGRTALPLPALPLPALPTARSAVV